MTGVQRCIGLSVVAVATAAVLSACSHSGNPASGGPPPNPPSASVVPSASPAAAAPLTIVGVTTAGALVTLNPTTGVVEQTLVPSGVIGNEVSVAPNGMIYFAAYYHCTASVEAIPMSGGTPAVIASGATAPAVSPDGTKLAYALVNACGPPVGSLQIRALSTGATISLPDSPTDQDGLTPVISHLSWAPDNRHLAVSIPEIQDNEGWALKIVDTAQAHYYWSPDAGVTTVPVTGSPTPQASYFMDAVYMPNGDLFVSRACCAGVPVHNTSRLMWEVTTSGAFVHQVAIGYPDLEHTSLDVSSDGQRLLYVAGTPSYVAGTPPTGTVYVSQGGATPRELTTGIVAAAWG